MSSSWTASLASLSPDSLLRFSVLILLTIVFVLILYRLINGFHANNNNEDEDEEVPFKLSHLYRRDQFPLNVYFTPKTRNSSNMKILYKATKAAIFDFNKSFNFKFFTVQDNWNLYPNIVTLQIACGNHTGCISGFDGKGGILAHATFPPIRKVCIDCKDIKNPSLKLILMHEFGHTIGLTHTTRNVKSLMQPVIDESLTRFTHHDVWRLKRLYKFLK